MNYTTVPEDIDDVDLQKYSDIWDYITIEDDTDLKKLYKELIKVARHHITITDK
jgi:hypothetical protein